MTRITREDRRRRRRFRGVRPSEPRMFSVSEEKHAHLVSSPRSHGFAVSGVRTSSNGIRNSGLPSLGAARDSASCRPANPTALWEMLFRLTWGRIRFPMYRGERFSQHQEPPSAASVLSARRHPRGSRDSDQPDVACCEMELRWNLVDCERRADGANPHMHTCHGTVPTALSSWGGGGVP